jgi:hypothetical protein
VFEDRDTLSEEAFERQKASPAKLSEKCGLPGSAATRSSQRWPSPASLSAARRFASPALVFNPHRQFEQLREAGRYERLRAAILQREVRAARVRRHALVPAVAEPGILVGERLEPGPERTSR